MRWRTLIALAFALVACGKTRALRLAGTDAGAVAVRDGATATDAPTRDAASADGWRLLDAATPDRLPEPDAPAADASHPDANIADVFGPEAPSADVAPAIPCADLKALADKGVFTTRRTTSVVFAPDRRWMVLRVHVEDPPGIVHPPKLVRIALPSGTETVLSEAGGAAQALGSSGAILLSGVGADGTDLALFDNAGLRTLAGGVCDQAFTPDGRRVYALRNCAANGTGRLDVIEVASGQVLRSVESVVKGKLAVSPSGGWLAYLVHDSDASASSDVLHLTSGGGDDYAISSRPGAWDPAFVSDDLLLFSAPNTALLPKARTLLEAHKVGTGNTSTTLATDVDAGFFGYQVSADGNWLLVAKSQEPDGGPITFAPAELLAVALNGGTRRTLTSNLLPFWNYQLAINAFELSRVSDYAVYTTMNDGLWSYPLSADGPTKISDDGMFVMAPRKAAVAIRETGTDANTTTLRLVTLANGADVATFTSNASLYNIQFTPDGRGLVFVESRTDPSGVASSTLRFLSVAHPDSPALAHWSQTLLYSSGPGPFTYPTGSYPVDPTGCFTIADVDTAPGPGTQLIVLPN